ncbi:MAG: hypothetical protein EPN48_18515 [Microbacteriaceae bacterium]|nr:MAG: hypothetical protein EPN48_18515 [Microbacteriaceae bacterium]
METTVIDYATLRSVTSTASTIIRLTVIATTAGFQCVSHTYDELGCLSRALLTSADRPYAQAKRTFDQVVSARTAANASPHYEIDVDDDPAAMLEQLPQFCDGVRFATPDEIAAIATAAPAVSTTNTRKALLSREKRQPDNLASRGYLALIVTALKSDAGEIRYGPERDITVNKQGGSLTLTGDLTDDERQLFTNIARAVGGSFQMVIRISNGRLQYNEHYLAGDLAPRLARLPRHLIGVFGLANRQTKIAALSAFLADPSPHPLHLSAPNIGAIEIRPTERDQLRPHLTKLIQGDTP